MQRFVNTTPANRSTRLEDVVLGGRPKAAKLLASIRTATCPVRQPAKGDAFSPRSKGRFGSSLRIPAVPSRQASGSGNRVGQLSLGKGSNRSAHSPPICSSMA